MQAKIKEIFESIQGEGLLVGEKEVFVRFVHCNLNCAYCDTDHFEADDTIILNEEELFDKIKNTDAKTLSLTGGEPLLQADFIASFLSKYKKYLGKNIFLETNGTLYNELYKVIDYVDLIGMDIKIQSASGELNNFRDNEEFLELAFGKVFIKVVFDSDIQDFEINSIVELAERYGTTVVLQPKMPLDPNLSILDIFNKFYSRHKETLLIPQTHKMLGVQ